MHRRLLGAAILLLFGAASSAAQPRNRPQPSVERVLALFEAEASGERGSRSSYPALSAIFSDCSRAGAARADSAARGLQSLALRASSPATRLHAALALVNKATAPGGVLPLVESVFERSERNGAVRRAIIMNVHRRPERQMAAAFLARIAAQAEDSQSDEDEGYLALYALTLAGRAGERELRRLHDAGTVGTSRGRAYLDRLAARGFPVADVP